MLLLSLFISTVAAASIRQKRLAIHPSRWNLMLWPDGVVPYDIAPHYSEEERNVIFSAMREFHKVTCIRFRPREESDKFYLTINKFYDSERCFSYIGRQVHRIFRTDQGNYETRMRLAPSCFYYNALGTVMHELMHILGFYHEHQREDRNPAIQASSHYNIRVFSRYEAYYMGDYDPKSLMHYDFPGVRYPRTYFTLSDINRINTLYNCRMWTHRR